MDGRVAPLTTDVSPVSSSSEFIFRRCISCRKSTIGICYFVIFRFSRSAGLNLWRSPFWSKFRFKFPETVSSGVLMEQHFPVDWPVDHSARWRHSRACCKKFKIAENNLARREISPRKFPFHSILLLKFREFCAEWFAFRKFYNFRIFGNLFKEICVPFAPV